MQIDDQLVAVAKLFDQSQRILFITGAGVSVDSGLPTYRGIGGLYEENSTEHGLTIEQALSIDVFAAHPEITWHYLWQLGEVSRHAKPNIAHLVMAAITANKPGSWVMTQNVDGLHVVAKTTNLVEMHGNARELYCVDCLKPASVEICIDNYGAKPELPPRCEYCDGIVRPNVILFGENLPQPAMDFLHHFDRMQFDLVVSVGTSSSFPYIAAPIALAYQNQVPSVEINPSMTVVSDSVDYAIRLGAAEAFDRICALTTCCDR